MAKAARFKVGTSGSPKHTEMRGDGSNMRNGASGTSSGVGPRGPRIGPGVLARVQPEYDRSKEGNGGAARGKPGRAYSEE